MVGREPGTHLPWYAITRDHITLVIGTKYGIYYIPLGKYWRIYGIYMGYYVVHESIVGSEYYGPPYAVCSLHV